MCTSCCDLQCPGCGPSCPPLGPGGTCSDGGPCGSCLAGGTCLPDVSGGAAYCVQNASLGACSSDATCPSGTRCIIVDILAGAIECLPLCP
jgi:hypothetical protein